MSYSGPIKNIVVVMLENRSYDNVLGFLYDPQNVPYVPPPPGQTGLMGLSRTASNIDPKTGKPVFVWGAPGDATTTPVTDPGEAFDDMCQQVLGLTSPEPFVNPYQSGAGPYGPMGGFVANYASRVAPGSVADVMHAFVPASLTTTAYLARTFMVCDQWYASAPTQTFANRMFSLAASPGAVLGVGYIDDAQYMPQWLVGGLNIEPNLLSRLDAVSGWQPGKPPAWKIYFHDYSIAAKLLSYARKQFESSANVNIANFDWQDYPPGNSSYKNPLVHPTTTFQEDVSNGTLPPFTLIEPRYTDNAPHAVYGLPPNSNHPGIGNYPFQSQQNTNPTDTYWGEFLLYDIYFTLRLSKYWEQTLLIITYDEHGGLYDHVVPPQAQPPGSSVPPALGGFGWNRFGVRVPTIVVSPYVPAGSRLVPPGATPFDHTSIIATAWECFNLDAGGTTSLNARDAAAPSILGALSETPENSPKPIAAPPRPAGVSSP